MFDAGQAVIQFAKEKHSTLEYAIKFYLSKAAFGEEAALYTDSSSPLGLLLDKKPVYLKLSDHLHVFRSVFLGCSPNWDM